ncbi:hypothetical protein XELAEV_18011039mg [Xenopus laevis]|uniref:Uncharacterized protein n=1 Tax=Xenopus laevis TaxID=8355 RepID=A0A974DVC7_XENLA|nr:hypothetical protein XELAEV_18011039mg [Xenopus laevis]
MLKNSAYTRVYTVIYNMPYVAHSFSWCCSRKLFQPHTSIVLTSRSDPLALCNRKHFNRLWASVYHSLSSNTILSIQPTF